MARIYPAEFRRDAVALVRSSDKTVTQIARELGLNRETLRREVAELRTERDLLVKAAAFFAKETTR
jgi:transposase